MSAAVATTLYEICDSIAFCLDTLEGLPEDEPGMRAEIEEQLAHLVAAELQKVDNISHMLAHFEAQAELAGAEGKRLQARKRAFERAGERLERCVRNAMDLSGKKKLEGETTTLSLQASPPSVVILDEALLPLAYKRHVPETWEPNRPLISKALKSGVEVPGADLSEGNVHLVRR